jgi:hypothetical protein
MRDCIRCTRASPSAYGVRCIRCTRLYTEAVYGVQDCTRRLRTVYKGVACVPPRARDTARLRRCRPAFEALGDAESDHDMAAEACLNAWCCASLRHCMVVCFTSSLHAAVPRCITARTLRWILHRFITWRWGRSRIRPLQPSHGGVPHYHMKHLADGPG